MIFFPMLVPVVTALVLLFVWHHKTLWWEILIPAGVSLIFALFMKFLVETVQTSDYEYHTGWLTKAEYYEEWTERHVSTDKDGNIEVTYTYHPPEFQAIDSNGYKIGITKQKFDTLCQFFDNRKKAEIWHANQSSIGDGNMFFTTYPGDLKRFTPVTTQHRYENRIEASNSVLKHPDVKEEEIKQYQLFAYPSIVDYYHCPSVLGSNPKAIAANKLLTYSNARMGKTKQVRMWILLFNNQPIDAALKQEQHWDGGNKNEIVLCIGLKNNIITWSHVFSWTTKERLKIDIRNFARSQQQFDLPIVEYMVEQVSKNWERRQFAEFSYLTVKPPMYMVVINFLLTIAINIGLSVWIIHNEHEQKSRTFAFS